MKKPVNKLFVLDVGVVFFHAFAGELVVVVFFLDTPKPDIMVDNTFPMIRYGALDMEAEIIGIGAFGY